MQPMDDIQRPKKGKNLRHFECFMSVCKREVAKKIYHIVWPMNTVDASNDFAYVYRWNRTPSPQWGEPNVNNYSEIDTLSTCKW